MSQYPKMKYRKGDEKSAELHGLRCDTLIVNDAEEEAAADGWYNTPAEAHGKKPESPRPSATDAQAADDELNSVREELEEFRKDNDDLAAQLRAMKAERDVVVAERDALKAQVAKFDGDKNGSVDGSKPKTEAKG